MIIIGETVWNFWFLLKKTIDFSNSYAKSSLAILAGINSGILSIQDLNKKDKTVAVKKGSTGHIYAQKHLANANVLVFDKENACVLEVVQGKADGFIYDQLTIYKNWSNNKTTTKPILNSFQKDFELGYCFKTKWTRIKKRD